MEKYQKGATYREITQDESERKKRSIEERLALELMML